MIFTTILSVVLVTAAAFTTRLVFNLRINEHKIYANIFTSELIEWLNSEREASWNNIYSMTTASPKTYCVNQDLALDKQSTGTTTFPTPSPCLANGLNGVFTRELIMERAGSNQVKATVKVSWKEEGKTYVDQSESVYTSY